MSNSNDKLLELNTYIIKLLVKSIVDAGHIPVVAAKNAAPSALEPSVSIQICYNEYMNKCFIEIYVNKEFKEHFAHSLVPIKTMFFEWLAKNFKQDTSVWPEIILPEDGKNEICDGSDVLTPFTVGYWESLSGRYEFFDDEIKVLKDYNNMAFPKYDDEYYEKVNQIFNQYYKTDFETFTRKIYELATEYNIKLDQKPRKDFADFIDTVEAINAAYAQVLLSEDRKDEFIDRYMLLLKEFRNNPAEYKRKLNLLYLEFGIIPELNKLVPEMFDLYKEKYEIFFEKELEELQIMTSYYDIRDINLNIYDEE